MTAEDENPAEEINRLRRCVNDLVSVLALPAMWAGGEASQIVRTLLDVMPDMLQLDLVYVKVEDPTGAAPIEMARTAPSQGLAGGAQEIATMLKEFLGDDPKQWPAVARCRLGEGDLSLAPLRLGLQGEIGVVVAGSRRVDFPGQTEKLLLRVTANQALIALQEAKLRSGHKRVAEELDQRVAQRTRELAAANAELGKEVAERGLAEQKLRREESELRRSEARNAAILSSALDCIVTIDEHGCITEFNPAAERTFGYRRDEVIGKRLAEVIIPPALREGHRRGFARYLATGEAHVLGKRLELTAARADGSEFPVELAITRIPLEGPPSFTGYLRDITERKQSEQSLRRSEAYLAEAQQLSHTGSFGWSVASGELTWSAETFRIFEFDPTTKPTVEIILQRVHPEDVAVVTQFIERASKDGRDFDYEHRLLMPDGTVKHVRVMGHAERAEPGKLEFVGVIMDVTKTKKAEAELRAAAKIAQGLVAVRAEVSAALAKPIPTREMLQECAQAQVRHLDAAFARIWTLDQAEDVLELQASAGAFTRLDGTHSRIKFGSLKVGLIAREQKPCLTNDVLNDPRIGDKEWAHSCGFVSFAGYPLVVDGRTVGVMAMFARHTLSDAAMEALASVADTIAQGFQRKRKEDELRRSEAYLAEAQKLSLTGSFGWKVSTDEHYWSEETFRIFGYEASAKIRLSLILDRVHPQDIPVVREVIGQATELDGFDYECRLLMPGGSVKYLHIVAHSVSGRSDQREFVGAVMDITARRRAEEALRQAQTDLAHVSRVMSLGELTASIAHELNQPLGSVVNNANAGLSLLTEEPPQTHEIREALTEIIQGADQAGAVIARVRQFLRKAPAERSELNLRDVIADVLALTRHDSAARQVKMRTELKEDMPSVQGDRVQLQQVLLNLVVNGMEAMHTTEESERVLTISGWREVRDGTPRCLLGVQDAGTGFKAEEMDQLFEAFYTTKPQGMGMGLAISRSIIEAHDGRLWAETNPGRGATFLFSLPAARSASS